jgi:hypothetical protein
MWVCEKNRGVWSMKIGFLGCPWDGMSSDKCSGLPQTLKLEEYRIYVLLYNVTEKQQQQ